MGVEIKHKRRNFRETSKVLRAFLSTFQETQKDTKKWGGTFSTVLFFKNVFVWLGFFLFFLESKKRTLSQSSACFLNKPHKTTRLLIFTELKKKLWRTGVFLLKSQNFCWFFTHQEKKKWEPDLKRTLLMFTPKTTTTFNELRKTKIKRHPHQVIFPKTRKKFLIFRNQNEKKNKNWPRKPSFFFPFCLFRFFTCYMYLLRNLFVKTWKRRRGAPSIKRRPDAALVLKIVILTSLGCF